MSHKWGTSTKVGDSFPNKAVDIGFVGLDPANRKMCARPLPRRRTPHRRSFARTLAAEPSSSLPPTAALELTRALVLTAHPRAAQDGRSQQGQDSLGDAPWCLHAHLIHVPGAGS